jgi:hypothetical protein
MGPAAAFTNAVMLLRTAKGQHGLARPVACHPATPGLDANAVDGLFAAFGSSMIPAGSGGHGASSLWLRAHRYAPGTPVPAVAGRPAWLAHLMTAAPNPHQHPECQGLLCLVVCAASPARHVGDAIDRLRRERWQVQVYATPDAASWLDIPQVAALTGSPMWTRPEDVPETLETPSLVVVAPATFHTVSGIARNGREDLWHRVGRR